MRIADVGAVVIQLPGVSDGGMQCKAMAFLSFLIDKSVASAKPCFSDISSYECEAILN